MALSIAKTAQALYAYLIPWLSGCRQSGMLSGDTLPPPDSNVDVSWVELDCSRLPSSTLGSDQHGATASERIEDDAFAMAAVAQCIGDQADGLDRGVQSQQFMPFAGEGIHTRIGPHVGPVAPVLAELEIVDVR